MGKLIVIEGVDASGKETQTDLLCKRLRATGKKASRISFPDYDCPSSALVKLYLSGALGTDPKAVNPYAAAIFYAADRYASYKMNWGKILGESEYVIADRYVTSNIIYQAAKFDVPDEKDRFIEWLSDLEYGRLELPKPDRVLFLNMEPEAAARLMEGRKNKITGEGEKDIHERDDAYLRRAYDNACGVAQKLGWLEIKCSIGGQPRTIEEISDEIAEKIL